MIRIFYSALVICSGVLLPIAANLIELHPNDFIQEHVEEEDFGVFCEVKDASKIEWLDPKGTPIARRTTSNQKSSSMFVEDNSVNRMMQLRFQPLKISHSGTYTCVAVVSNAELRKNFTLTVITPIRFGDKKREYYALLGTSQMLYCEVQSTPASSITWHFKENKVEGDDFTIVADGLQVKNVTEDKLGNYTCTASYTTDRNGFTKSIDIALKQGISPVIKSIYKNNTVHGIFNTVVTIRCPIVADPWPEITWIRNSKEFKPPQNSANITNTPNGSVLQFVLSDNKYLGDYTCKVANQFNTTSETFTLEEGALPDVPTVHVRDTADKTLRFDVTRNISQELSNYRIVFKKDSESEDEWKTLDFGLTDSPTNPYSINNLEPNTDYVYKVGACSEDDLCAFTNITKITTQALATSSTNTIHTVVTQAFILLPAFILGLMQRHRTT